MLGMQGNQDREGFFMSVYANPSIGIMF